MFLAGFVDGEIDGVSGARAEAHGADAAVEGGGALGLEDRTEGLTDRDGLDGAGAEGLHVGLDGVDGEHGQVLDAAGDGAGDHELPEVEAVVCGGGDGDFRRLEVRPEIWVLEFGGCCVCGHEFGAFIRVSEKPKQK